MKRISGAIFRAGFDEGVPLDGELICFEGIRWNKFLDGCFT